MKNHEQFRASVYARAEREKERLAARRLKMRNASLSIAMVLLVAALAVPVARNMRTGDEGLTAPETGQQVQQVLHIPNRAAPVRVLLMSTASGETHAVVLENQDQQKDFASLYKAAMNLGDDDSLPMTPAADAASAIHSTDELMEFLAGLLEVAGTVMLDYDEAFFLDNNLYAMPMDLAPQQGSREATTAAKAARPTIPDGTDPDATTIPGMETSTEFTEAETATDELAALQNLPESELLQGADVKVLLLVPVNKG